MDNQPMNVEPTPVVPPAVEPMAPSAPVTAESTPMVTPAPMPEVAPTPLEAPAPVTTVVKEEGQPDAAATTVDVPMMPPASKIMPPQPGPEHVSQSGVVMTPSEEQAMRQGQLS